jgi:hypothetical protein
MFPIAFHPIYQHPLPEGHRFPMLKYELLTIITRRNRFTV